MRNPIPISWQYIPIICIRIFSSFPFFAPIYIYIHIYIYIYILCYTFMYIKCLIFSCDLVNLKTPVHFLNIASSDIIAITSRCGGSWKMLLWNTIIIDLIDNYLCIYCKWAYLYRVGIIDHRRKKQSIQMGKLSWNFSHSNCHVNNRLRSLGEILPETQTGFRLSHETTNMTSMDQL